jgi:hypothetical protein
MTAHARKQERRTRFHSQLLFERLNVRTLGPFVVTNSPFSKPETNAMRFARIGLLCAAAALVAASDKSE